MRDYRVALGYGKLTSDGSTIDLGIYDQRKKIALNGRSRRYRRVFTRKSRSLCRDTGEAQRLEKTTMVLFIYSKIFELAHRANTSTARPSTATAPASDNTEDNVRGVQREDKEDAPAAEGSAKSASATTNIPSESHDGGTGPATEVKTTEATDPDLGHDSKDSSTTTKPEVDIHPDKDDDHLIDGDEDTVIY